MVKKKNTYLSVIIFLGLMTTSLASRSMPTQEEMDQVPALKEAHDAEAKGNYIGALRHYRLAYKGELAKLTALSGIARSLNKSGEHKEAEKILRDAVTSSPFDLERRLLLVDHYNDLKDDNRALVELAIAKNIGNSDGRVFQRRSVVYKRSGKFELAIQDLTAFLEKSPGPNANALLLRAQCYFNLKQYESALKDIKKSFEIEPFVPETLSTYVRILATQNLFDAADPIAKQCTEVDPLNLICWEQRGDMMWEQKKSGASEHYQRALNLAPKDANIRKKFADALEREEKFKEADLQYTQLLKLQPNHESAMRASVESLLKRKAYGAAAVILEAYHKVDPKNLWVSLEYSKLMLMGGRADAASRVLKQTYRSNPSDIAAMYYGYSLFQESDFSGAEDVIEDIKDAKLAKDYNLGVCLLRRKKWSRAISYFNKVNTESKNFFNAQINIAIALQEDGRIKDALSILSTTRFPQEQQAAVAKQIEYLNESSTREPSSDRESSGPLKANTEWELPSL